jgi:uncharacterized damage-inducible protein DinB
LKIARVQSTCGSCVRTALYTGFFVAFLVVIASSAFAQPPQAGQKLTISTGVQRWYATVKTNLTLAAEKMPESGYGAKPSTMPEVRTFGQLLAHVAQAQFNFCAPIKGVPNPMQGKRLETELKTKAEFVKALADSFAFCDDAYASLTDANANDMITQGAGQWSRAAALSYNVTHDNEMAGTVYVYMRAQGLVPPSTENAPQRGGPPAGRGAGNTPGR